MDLRNLSIEDRTFIIKDKSGKERTFLYDPDKMSLAQIADAQTKLEMYDKMIETLPTVTSEMQEAMKAEVLKKGKAALLMEIDPKTKEPYDRPYIQSSHPGLDAMDSIKGAKEWHRLESCKANFFMNMGIISIESTKQLNRIISELKKEGMKSEDIELLIKTAVTGNLDSLMTLEKNSTAPNTSNRNTEKKQVRK